MTPLAGHPARARRREPWLWGLAALFALLAHGALALALLWNPPSQMPETPAAAPLVMDVAMVAPAAPPSDAPPGPQQVETPPPPEPPPEEPPPPEPEVEPEVVLEEVPEPEPVPEPVERREEPEPEVAESMEPPAPESSAPAGADVAETDQVAAAPNLGMPSAQAVAAEQRWHSTVVAHLERRKRYPRQAQVMRREGMPMVRFTLDRDGRVLEAELEQPSGEALLDREAVALIRRAEPLPKPPPEVSGERISLVVPIEFFINR